MFPPVAGLKNVLNKLAAFWETVMLIQISKIKMKIFGIGFNNHMAQHGKCYIFSLKITPH